MQWYELEQPVGPGGLQAAGQLLHRGSHPPQEQAQFVPE